MKECAFCKNEAKSGEHLWDAWINKQLPKKTRFNTSKRLSIDSQPIKFVSVGLNEKIPVVCTQCNGGWMSDLTNGVKERFSGTILRRTPISLTARDAALLAAFTLMKATVKDYCYSGDPFFDEDTRTRFRMSLAIPPWARMWVAAYRGDSRYAFGSNFYRVEAAPSGPLRGMEFFCYTYIVGYLTLQFVAPRWQDVGDWEKPLVALVPNQIWHPAAIQFWPYSGPFLWPPAQYLGDDAIEHFIYRFNAPISVPLK